MQTFELPSISSLSNQRKFNMATELGLISLSQLQKPAHHQSHQHTNSVDNDSWEAHACAEDRRNAMGTTWPCRSYTCSFCRREFRSAQALGGHMNVHRRDRARLRESPRVPYPSPSAMLHSNDFVGNGGMCLLYPIPTHGSISPSTFLSISPDYVHTVNLPNRGDCLPGKVGMVSDDSLGKEGNSSDDDGVAEQLDLELRLGW